MAVGLTHQPVKLIEERAIKHTLLRCYKSTHKKSFAKEVLSW